MKKLWAVVRREVGISVLTRSFLIGTIATPLILVVAVLLPQLLSPQADEQEYRIGILEIGGTQLADLGSAWSADTMPGTGATWRVIYQSCTAKDTSGVKAARSADVGTGKLDVFLIADTSLIASSQISFCTTGVASRGFLRELRSRITGYVTTQRLAELGIEPGTAAHLVRPVTLQAGRGGVFAGNETAFHTHIIATVVFVMILLLTVMGYGFQVMRGIIEEKSTRMIEVLVSSMTPFQIMMGKLLGQGIAALVQLIGWAAVGSLILVYAQAAGVLGHITEILSVSFAFWFIVFLILGYLFLSGWLSWVGAVVDSEQEAKPLMVPVIVLFSLSFMVGMVVVDDPDSSLAHILSFVPPLSPAMMIMRMRFSEVPVWEPAVAALLLAAAATVIIWIGSRIFRVGILMQGKRPTVPEIVRWARHG